MYAGGVDWVAIQKALQNWVVACTGLPADHVIWSQQYAPRTTQPSVNMKLAFIDDHGMPWLDYDPNPLVIPTLTITSISGSTFTKVAHGLLTGDGPVRLASTLTLPGNVVALTNYWIIKVTADTFKLATTFRNAMNGVFLTLSSTGSGVITLDDTDDTRRAGQEVKVVSRSLLKAILTLECYTNTGVGLNMANATLWRVNARRLLPTPLEILEDANIGVIEVGQVKTIGGTQDLVIFEPRALVNVMLHITSEDSENGTIIETTEITDEHQPHTFTVGL